MFLAVGAALNLIAGIFTLVRYFSSDYKSKLEHHFLLSSPVLNFSIKNDIELGVGIVAILTGIAMFGDLILSFLK